MASDTHVARGSSWRNCWWPEDPPRPTPRLQRCDRCGGPVTVLISPRGLCLEHPTPHRCPPDDDSVKPPTW